MKNRVLFAAGFGACQLGLLVSSPATVPERQTLEPPPFVAVSGNVRSPGRILWTLDLTLMGAIGLAGGPGWRLPPTVFIVRDGKRIELFGVSGNREQKTDAMEIGDGQMSGSVRPSFLVAFIRVDLRPFAVLFLPSLPREVTEFAS